MAELRERLGTITGLGLLAIGLALLLFTFAQALAIAQAPGSFVQTQLPPPARGPSSSFDWMTSDVDAAFTDTAQPGTAAIAAWNWDFGDGIRSEVRNPTHRYASPGIYQASLVVTDAQGRAGTSVAQVEAVPGATRSGRSLTDPSAGIAFDPTEFVLPLAIGALTVGLYVAMGLIGGMIVKAGWSMLKPRPEVIRVRLKPSSLAQTFEADASYARADVLPPPPQF